MVEMRSDLARKSSFSTASEEAKNDGLGMGMYESMQDRLDHHRQKQLGKRKRRLPWFTIISIITIAPIFFIGDVVPTNPTSLMKGQSASTSTPEQAVTESIEKSDASETAQISVTIGGRTITRTLTVEEIRQMQAMQQTQGGFMPASSP